MNKKQASKTFAQDDLKTIQDYFHALIIERTQQEDYTELPEISNETYEISKTYDVPGIDAYFCYRLTERNGKPLIKTTYCPKNWWRYEYEITTDGCVFAGVKSGYQVENTNHLYHKNGEEMTSDQRAHFEKLCQMEQSDEASIFLKKCDLENRTDEYRMYLEQLRATAMAVNQWYLSQ